MNFSVTISQSDGLLPWERLKEHFYAVPPTATDDHVAAPQTAMTTVYANMLRRVRGNTVQRAAVCLERNRGRFEHLL